MKNLFLSNMTYGREKKSN